MSPVRLYFQQSAVISISAYSTINSSKSSSISSISGDIDITLPVKTPTDLEFKRYQEQFIPILTSRNHRKTLKKLVEMKRTIHLTEEDSSSPSAL